MQEKTRSPVSGKNVCKNIGSEVCAIRCAGTSDGTRPGAGRWPCKTQEEMVEYGQDRLYCSYPYIIILSERRAATSN